MRKVCLIVMFFCLDIIFCFAYTPAEMNVIFDVEANDPGYMEFGFSSTPDGQEKIEEFQLVFGEGQSEDVDELYAYWHVVSTSSFDLSLYCEPLIGEDGISLLDWGITWLTDDDQPKRIGGENEYGAENSDLILTRVAGQGDPLAEVGSKKLDITIFSDEIQKAGSYSGCLILKMESI